MLRTPLLSAIFGLTLFAVGCEKREGENCSALCTDVFEDCTADCGDDEECTIVCEDDNEVCLGGCDADQDVQE